MSKGRKPTPTHLKIITGNPGKRPVNESELDPPRTRPSAPEHLTTQGAEIWGQLVMVLDEMGVLTTMDLVAVEVLVEAFSDFRSANDEIKKGQQQHKADIANPINEGKSDVSSCGRFYRTQNASGSDMWRAHPAVALKSDADRRIRAWCAEFGMTPAARSRLVVGAGSVDQTNKQRPKAESYYTG